MSTPPSSPSSTSSSPPSSPTLIAVRLLLLALAAGGVVFAAFLHREPAQSVSSRDGGPRATYVCPMHPQVVSAAPGDCPICWMALEPRVAALKSEGGTHAHPAAPLAAAASRAGTLSLAEPGTLRAFDAVSRVKAYDLSLEMRGAASATTADGGTALFHRDEIALIAAGETGLFYPSSGTADGRPPGIAVRVEAGAPQPWDGATALIRFRTDDGATLSAGATGSLKLATRLRRDLVVRASAVLRGPEGPYVLVVSNDRRTLTKRPVEIGNVVYGYATIIAGLRQDESVVARRAFFLDAERRRGLEEAL